MVRTMVVVKNLYPPHEFVELDNFVFAFASADRLSVGGCVDGHWCTLVSTHACLGSIPRSLIITG
jgi:hypothetical protein